MRRAVRAAAAVVAIGVVVAGLLVARTALFTEHVMDQCAREARLREGDGVRAGGWSWRPLGARCEVTRRDGRTEARVVSPW